MKKYILTAVVCAVVWGLCDAKNLNGQLAKITSRNNLFISENISLITRNNFPTSDLLKIRGTSKTVFEDFDTLFVNPNPESHYDSLVHLETVVISSNHRNTSRRNAPQMVGVVSQKTIKMTPSVCVADVLSYQSGVRVENNCSSCGYKQARINGLDGHYTMIMIDSRPMLSSVSNLYGLEQIPTSMIERTEVMRGGGSALYGAGAVGGTINIITKEPTENFAEISQSLMAIGMSNSFDNVTSFSSAFINDSKTSGISLFGSNRQRDGYSYYDDGYTTLPKLNVLSVGSKMFFKTGEFSKLDFSYNLMKDERRGGNKLSLPAEQSNIAEQSEHLLHTLTANYHFNSSDNRWHGDFFGSFAAVNRKSYSGGYISDDEPDTLAWKYHTRTRDITFSGGGIIRYRFDKMIFLPSYLTFGAEYSSDVLKDEALGFAITDKQTTHTESAYVQNEWTDAKWNILVGLRADKHNLIDNVIVSPRLSVKYSLLDNMDLRFTYSKGFRAPQIFDEDLHVSMSNGERFAIKLADGLKEETSQSISFSADYYFNIKRVRMNFMCEGFFTALNDVFAERQTDKTDAKGNNVIERYNASGASYYGVSLEWKTKYSSTIATDVGFTFQKSRYKEAEQWSQTAAPTKRVVRTPDTYGYLTLEYSPVKDLDIDLTGTYSGNMFCPHFESSGTDKDILKKTPDFFDLNAKITYSFNLASSCVMSLSCGVVNIFDSFQKDLDRGPERDSDYIYGPMLPRSLNCEVKIRF